MKRVLLLQEVKEKLIVQLKMHWSFYTMIWIVLLKQSLNLVL